MLLAVAVAVAVCVVFVDVSLGLPGCFLDPWSKPAHSFRPVQYGVAHSLSLARSHARTSRRVLFARRLVCLLTAWQSFNARRASLQSAAGPRACDLITKLPQAPTVPSEFSAVAAPMYQCFGEGLTRCLLAADWNLCVIHHCHYRLRSDALTCAC
jgi:hypothetical protein